jgi:hypothetical protein
MLNSFRQRSRIFKWIWPKHLEKDTRKRGGIFGEQCSVVFALIVTEKDSGGWVYPSHRHT